ncbi:MAG: tail fiber domain-containing protein [Ignavibacteriales bacterium]|nr:tail fiber domain-containing protein [Ignavibacteriales bacterium]
MKSIKLFIFAFLLLVINILPQNIEAKLGAAGVFSIKSNGNAPVFQVSGDEGNVNIGYSINLANTTNYNTGVIYKGANRFIHDKGTDNIFIGNNSGNFFFNTFLSKGNTAVGSNTLLELTTGTENSSFGLNSLQSNTDGGFNCAFGSHTLTPNTTGSFNSAFGYSALRSNTTSSFNSAFGLGSLFSNSTGISNSAFGTHSLFSNTSGNRNTAIGDSAGRNMFSGSNNIFIGYNSQPSSSSVSNEITLGNNLITTIRANVTSITSLSDVRDKKNIKDLSLGLEFLMKIHPREFNWDKREWYSDGKSDGSKMQDLPTAGFIAQELDMVQTESEAEWLKLVLKENPDRIEASAGNLFPIVVKAVQELKKEKDSEIAQLKSENVLLKKELETLKELQLRLAKLEQVLTNSDAKFSSNITE